jgi:mannose-1-phosphate guanylyltransferase
VSCATTPSFHLSIRRKMARFLRAPEIASLLPSSNNQIPSASMLQPVVLCRGSGTRLWPLSRKALPKQFVPLIDGKSLLAMTLERVAPPTDPAAGVVCVGAEDHRFPVLPAFPSTGYGHIDKGQIHGDVGGGRTTTASSTGSW